MSQESFLFFAHYSGHQMHNGRLSLLIGYSQASQKTSIYIASFEKHDLMKTKTKYFSSTFLESSILCVNIKFLCEIKNRKEEIAKHRFHVKISLHY